MNQIPPSLLTGIEEFLQSKFSSTVQVKSFSPIGGGCINHCGKLETSAGTFFLKWNYASKFPSMLKSEAKGLQWLREPKVISIPHVLGVEEVADYQFIVMEFIHQQSHSKKYWENFGYQLAQLHRISAEQFGLDHANYMGSLNQINDQQSSWIDFFIHQRLSRQVEWAIASNHFSSGMRKTFDRLYQRLPSLLPTEKPSLLHGDLWSGNLIANENGEPCLIDPAVYFGHREADLAMTQLFGGFDDQYLQSYQEAFPLSPGFLDRVHLYNLYPLLVHVNLFGGAYANQVNSILNHYIN